MSSIAGQGTRLCQHHICVYHCNFCDFSAAEIPVRDMVKPKIGTIKSSVETVCIEIFNAVACR